MIVSMICACPTCKYVTFLLLHSKNNHPVLFRAVLVNTIIIFFAYLTVGIVGAVASVYFKDCDPLLNGDITNGDQVGDTPTSGHGNVT